jgi:hypothetical protein
MENHDQTGSARTKDAHRPLQPLHMSGEKIGDVINLIMVTVALPFLAYGGHRIASK